jgi:hypothetical protein
MFEQEPLYQAKKKTLLSAIALIDVQTKGMIQLLEFIKECRQKFDKQRQTYIDYLAYSDDEYDELPIVESSSSEEQPLNLSSIVVYEYKIKKLIKFRNSPATSS